MGCFSRGWSFESGGHGAGGFRARYRRLQSIFWFLQSRWFRQEQALQQSCQSRRLEAQIWKYPSGRQQRRQQRRSKMGSVKNNPCSNKKKLTFMYNEAQLTPLVLSCFLFASTLLLTSPLPSSLLPSTLPSTTPLPATAPSCPGFALPGKTCNSLP